MWSWTKKWMRRLTVGGLLAGVLGTMAPTAYEGYVHNEDQQDRVENAMNKIVQEQFFVTDPAAAGALKDTRDTKLREIATAAYGSLNPGWNKPVDLFQSGVKRMTNAMPGISGFIGPKLGLGPEYYSGNYSTAFDDMAEYVTALSNLGVGIAFDSGLSKINAGSAYTRDIGLITINPELSQGDMVEHTRRQILRLNQELVLPYERVVKSGNELTSTFNERFGQLRVMTSMLDGPVVTLPLAGGTTAQFAEVPRKNYNPPLLKQPAPESKDQPPAPAQGGKGKQPKPAGK